MTVCQRVENERTPLVNRNHRHFDHLISASTVPFLRDTVDRLSMLERVVAFGIVHVDRLPRRQDEDLGEVSVLREPLAQLDLAQRCETIEPAHCIKDASLKENRLLACFVMNEVFDVYSQRFPREHIRLRS